MRQPKDFFRDIPDAEARQEHGRRSPAKIIEQLEGPFDPSEFIDRYEEALKALIASKDKGEKPQAAPAPKDTRPTDLMEALRQSLQRGGAPPARKAAPARQPTAAPKTARRASTRKKAG